MEININDFFDNVRTCEYGDAYIHKFLKTYSNDFDIEILKLILKDLEFYFFIEKEEMSSQFSDKDIDNSIEYRKTHNLEIPYRKNTLLKNLNTNQIECRKKLKKDGFDPDVKVLDIEKLLFPNEFFCLYQLRNFINHKIENSQSNKINTQIPENDYSDTVPLEKMILLEKLGIIKYVQSLQNDGLNEKQTAEILSSFTGITSGTIAKNLGVMLGAKKNDTDKNSPYKNPKNLQLANNKVNKFNIDLTKIIK